MILILSVLSILLGTLLACVAERHSRFVARIEASGGLCLICGLAMIGGALPIFA